MNATTRKSYCILSRKIHGGITEQQVFRFPNGYGASVIRGPYSYGGPDGLFELGVIKFSGIDNDEFELCYETPITEDVIGHLTNREVGKYLDQICRLPKDDTKCPTLAERTLEALVAVRKEVERETT